MIAVTIFRLARQLPVVISLCILTGCATYSEQALSVRDALRSGQIDLAYAEVEENKQYFDVVLSNMNKGILRRMKDDFIGSNHALEKAKNRINNLYGISITEQLGSVIINDAVIEYQGARFEQLLVHAYMAMNYIQMNDLDAARVEMLQADIKMREWGQQPDDDPFIRYFSGMIYEALGEYDEALVAYRYAVEAYEAKRERQWIGIPERLQKDFIRLLRQEGRDDEANDFRDKFSITTYQPVEPGQGELIVILSNGLSPLKTENSITTFSQEIENTVRIAIPVYYAKSSSPLLTARSVIARESVMFETVEDLDGLARSELEDKMPEIVARALVRAIVKHKTQKKAQETNPLGGLLMTITNLVTERADTRSWTTLPQEIQMSRHVLASGSHQLTIEMVNPSGAVVDRLHQVVSILPGKVTFVFKHWIAPRWKPETNKNQPDKSTGLKRVLEYLKDYS